MEDFIPNPFFKKLMSVIYSWWRQRKLMVNHRWDTIFPLLITAQKSKPSLGFYRSHVPPCYHISLVGCASLFVGFFSNNRKGHCLWLIWVCCLMVIFGFASFFVTHCPFLPTQLLCAYI